jgi:hypothetical protein
MRSTKTKFTAVALTTAALAAIPTAASAAAPSGGLIDAYDTVYQRVEKAGGHPGRNIAEDGIRKGGEARAATRAEVLASLSTLRTMHLSLSGGGATAQAPASPAGSGTTGAGQATAPATGGGAGSGLESVAHCESGGNPAAVSPDGQYRGKYQFDQQTWESVGGSGDPAAAPEAVQDQKAAQLQAQRGSSPWPVCG